MPSPSRSLGRITAWFFASCSTRSIGVFMRSLYQNLYTCQYLYRFWYNAARRHLANTGEYKDAVNCFVSPSPSTRNSQTSAGRYQLTRIRVSGIWPALIARLAKSDEGLAGKAQFRHPALDPPAPPLLLKVVHVVV